VPTHPLWRPYRQISPDEAARARVGPRQVRPVRVVEHDPEWVEQFAYLRAHVEAALGGRALAVHHVGSTAVSGLWAKPTIDVDLIVADPAWEEDYLPDLERAGFRLTIREPEWEEHRCLTFAAPDCSLHVVGPDAIEPRRHLVFREWLATHPKERSVYAAQKRELAREGLAEVRDYDNRKAGLAYDIYERIFAADPDHEHDPRPRAN
jgi:GrpB-like predicted nucleotidyltransferase (UPF0157 family)